MITDKFEISEKVSTYLKEMHIKLGRDVERIITDRGTEYAHIEYLLPTQIDST